MKILNPNLQNVIRVTKYSGDILQNNKSSNITKTSNLDTSVLHSNTDISKTPSNSHNIESLICSFAPYSIERFISDDVAVENSREWKKMMSNRKRYSENYILRYSDEVFDVERREMIEPSVFAYNAMAKSGFNANESIKFVSCLIGLKVLGIDRKRYSSGIGGSYSCFPSYFICSEYEFLDDREELQIAK